MIIKDPHAHARSSRSRNDPPASPHYLVSALCDDKQIQHIGNAHKRGLDEANSRLNAAPQTRRGGFFEQACQICGYSWSGGPHDGTESLVALGSIFAHTAVKTLRFQEARCSAASAIKCYQVHSAQQKKWRICVVYVV